MIHSKFLSLSMLTFVLLSLFSINLQAKDRETVADRLAPVGKLCMKGESCAQVNSSSSDGSKDPAQIYSSNCQACHATDAAGAPKLGDVAAWSARLSAKGLDTIYNNAINGVGAMPAKGLCMSCSNDDIIAVVDYILEKSK